MASGYFADDSLTSPLTEIVQTEGTYPSPGTGGASDDDIGLVRTFAFNFAPGGASLNGQALPTSQYSSLFNVVGTDYGGNGSTTFDVANLQGTVPVGASGNLGASTGADTAQVSAAQFPASLGGTSQSVAIAPPTQAITYLICVSGVYPSSSIMPNGAFIGEVVPFLGSVVPAGFMVANGATLSINQNQALYSLLGTIYGGNGTTNFQLPNLVGRDIVGTGSSTALGQVVGASSVTLTTADLPKADGGSGASFSDQSPGLGLEYIICVNGGIFPNRDNTGGYLDSGPYLGEVRAYAGAAYSIPEGWVLASGQVLPINSNAALFSLLGTTYGGNGTTTFALPNLGNSTVSGTGSRAGNSYYEGITHGSPTTTLVVTNATPCYCPGTLILTAEGERPVEGLRIGDVVVTAGGEHRPIRWVGRRSYAGRFLRANPGVQPIRFCAGCLGDGLPRRDLLVSPEHAMFLDGMLIPARCLVNGTTIMREQGLSRVDYHHVELDSHDVLLAEGAAAESFMDDDSRGLFHNAAEFGALYPGAAPASGYCARRVEGGRALQSVRTRLERMARAA